MDPPPPHNQHNIIQLCFPQNGAKYSDLCLVGVNGFDDICTPTHTLLDKIKDVSKRSAPDYYRLPKGISSLIIQHN